MIPREIVDSLVVFFSLTGEPPFQIHSSVPFSGGCINHVHRIDVYNLYPLLVHLNLFGPGYFGSVERIIRRF